jgi:hypothetical protein
MTAHDNIDNLLVADLHGELSESERGELHAHLLDCAICRQAHQETKIMNQLLEEKLEKPDAAFEQRMLGGFRNRVPEKQRSIPNLIVGFMRLRSAQIAGVAAILLALVQVGRMVTGEHSAVFDRKFAEAERVIVSGGNIPTDKEVNATLNYAGRLDAYSRARAEVDTINRQLDAPALSSEAKKQKVEERDEKLANLKKMESDLASVGRPLTVGTSAADGGFVIPAQSPASPPAAKPPQEESYAASAPTEMQNTTAEETGPNPTLSLNRDYVNKSKARAAEESVVESEAVMAPAGASEATPPALANRKLIRNATVELEIVSFDAAVQKITAFASEEKGYVATTSSEKQENGKLQGEVVVKVLPENLDHFLQKIRGLGELKNQTLAAEDVTKAYFDTESRLKNSRVMEQRLVDMLKTKTGKVSDLLQVEKEIGRVREDIEKMQGELKFWDSQVQFATVTITLAEKDLEEPAKFLLKERAQLSLYTPEVEKIYNEIKSLASPKVQITNAHLERNNAGQVSAQIGMLIAPEESDNVVSKTKSMGRVENFQTQTERISQGGEGLSESAKTKRDKFELNITITRDEQEQALQQTNLRIRTSAVDDKTKSLRDLATKQNGRVRSSSFSRDPNGREFANITLRVPMKNYNALMQSLDSLGKVEDVSVQRQDRTGADVDLASAPADLTIQIYSQGNIVSSDTGIFATLRNTIGQGAGALMWSVRMIGVAIAFLAPWVIALVAMIWIVKRIVRSRRR